MRILISYSKFHYDPPAKIDLTHSASFIIRAIYEACQGLAEVTYIDPAESDSVRGQAFDLFVGQISQFSKISSNIHAKHSVLFMATTHPANRNKVLRAEAKRLGVPVTETMKAAKDTFDRADLILQIGGDWALQALLNAGVSRSKILNIHYGAQHIPFNDKRNFSKPYRFLFLATELGLRKGIVHALDAFVGLDGDYQLTLVGKIPGPEYESRIREATDRNDLIRYVGWIESNTEAYQNLLADHHFIVFPSLEEGEAGTVLEGLSSGLVPITTGERVGIDYSPLGNFVPHADNSELVKRAIALSPEGLGTLSKQARHYVDTIHYWPLFKARLQEIFDKILLGRLAEITRPKVSLILPVFNKEESIVRLLRHLHQTTRSYQNYDLHLFFDGCIDRSRERAEKYLAKCDIDVTYYETPNLFETRTNNIGLRAADGKYCVILQDDIVLYEKHWLEKFVYFMETNPRVGALGGLAGVNYYPSDTSLEGPGVSSYKFERSRRIDIQFEPKISTSLCAGKLL
ncbi:MAG: glycosyltransferase [Candidatus Bathyarchaeota archaeon]|nr:glycosyltransferase [Candidatus Bathyarchaeota archaeon]